jgi:hypothetical protein
MGHGHNPYADPERPGTIRPLRAGIVFAVSAPLAIIPLTAMGYALAVVIILPLMWVAIVTILAKLPPKRFEGAYVDNAAIEYADIADAAGIAREVEASLRHKS